MMRKLVKEKAVRYVLKLKCVNCGCQDRYILGYDYGSDSEAKENIATYGWNGWLLKDTELCIMCRTKGNMKKGKKMRSHEVKSPEDALLYLADCQLATVVQLAYKKSRGKGDYERQKDIAQHFCDWIKRFNIDVNPGNRVQKVFEQGSVEKFANLDKYETCHYSPCPSWLTENRCGRDKINCPQGFKPEKGEK
jgi:hypothetical protein